MWVQRETFSKGHSKVIQFYWHQLKSFDDKFRNVKTYVTDLFREKVKQTLPRLVSGTSQQVTHHSGYVFNRLYYIFNDNNYLFCSRHFIEFLQMKLSYTHWYRTPFVFGFLGTYLPGFHLSNVKSKYTKTFRPQCTFLYLVMCLPYLNKLSFSTL